MENKTGAPKKSEPSKAEFLAVALVAKAVQNVINNQVALDFSIIDPMVAKGNGVEMQNLAELIQDEIENSEKQLKESFIESGADLKIAEALGEVLRVEALKIVSDRKPVLAVAMILEEGKRINEQAIQEINSN